MVGDAAMFACVSVTSSPAATDGREPLAWRERALIPARAARSKRSEWHVTIRRLFVEPLDALSVPTLARAIARDQLKRRIHPSAVRARHPFDAEGQAQQFA